jgi:hypothetical protein
MNALAESPSPLAGVVLVTIVTPDGWRNEPRRTVCTTQ